MDPSFVPVVIVGVLVVLAGVAVLVALATERPDPAEAALAYEEAWDRLDFALLWRLSAPSLRDGRTLAEFVAEKEALYAGQAHLSKLVDRVRVDDVVRAGRLAKVTTRLELADGTVFHHGMRLRFDRGRWMVEIHRVADDRAAGKLVND